MLLRWQKDEKKNETKSDTIICYTTTFLFHKQMVLWQSRFDSSLQEFRNTLRDVDFFFLTISLFREALPQIKKLSLYFSECYSIYFYYRLFRKYSMTLINLFSEGVSQTTSIFQEENTHFHNHSQCLWNTPLNCS